MSARIIRIDWEAWAASSVGNTRRLCGANAFRLETFTPHPTRRKRRKLDLPRDDDFLPGVADWLVRQGERR